MLPDFDAHGLLPPGVHELDFGALYESHLVRGSIDCGDNCNWDHNWRLHLIQNLEILVDQLVQVGISDVFIGGSFVEDKDHPNDIDGYFVCDRNFYVSGELERQLNQLDPFNCWTWDPDSRIKYRGYGKQHLPMWHYYRIELYPDFDQGTGIVDSNGKVLTFPEAFRRSRLNRPKGIIQLGGFG